MDPESNPSDPTTIERSAKSYRAYRQSRLNDNVHLRIKPDRRSLVVVASTISDTPGGRPWNHFGLFRDNEMIAESRLVHRHLGSTEDIMLHAEFVVDSSSVTLVSSRMISDNRYNKSMSCRSHTIDVYVIPLD